MTDTNSLLGTELKTFPGSYFGGDTYYERFSDAADEVVTVFQCPKACDLTGAMVYCEKVQGTSPYYKFELFALDTANWFAATGSALASTATFQGVVGDMSVDFSSAYTCTQGEVLMLKLSYGDSGTIDPANYSDFVYASATVRFNLLPMAAYYQAGPGTYYGPNSYYPTMVVHTDLSTGVDFGGIYNVDSGDYLMLNADGDRCAQRMEIPASENLEFHIDGFRYTGRAENNGGIDLVAAIWDEDGDVLASVTIDSHQQNYQMGQNYSREYLFTSTATVGSGDVVYMGLENTGGSGGTLLVGHAEPNGAAGLKSWPGGDAFYSSEWDESAGTGWVDDKTKRLLLNPVLSSIHGVDSGGGGGSSISGPSIGLIG